VAFIMVAAVIRMIDALKTFDTIYVITLGGPGTSSETINILLYQTAFAYYDLGYGSAIVVVFFLLILAISLVLLRVRQREAMAMKRHRARRLAGRWDCTPPSFYWCHQHAFFLWMLSLSLKNELDNTAYPPVFIPNSAHAGELRRRFREERLPEVHDQLGDCVVLGNGLALLFGVPLGMVSRRRKPPRQRR